MKNKSLFASRVVVTIIIAGLVSSGIGVILIFIIGNLGFYDDAWVSINATMRVVFGVLIGYKLNDLVREFKN